MRRAGVRVTLARNYRYPMIVKTDSALAVLRMFQLIWIGILRCYLYSSLKRMFQSLRKNRRNGEREFCIAQSKLKDSWRHCKVPDNVVPCLCTQKVDLILICQLRLISLSSTYLASPKSGFKTSPL